MPIDNGKVQIGSDKSLIKKIIILAATVLMVIILCVVMMYLDDIEYASSGGKSKDDQNTDQATNGEQKTSMATPVQTAPSNNGGFTGYEAFGGSNPFFDEN